MDAIEHVKLMEQPEIQKLLAVLAENRLKQEQEQVESMVNYLDNMENQFGQVLSELKQMREQLDQIQDQGIKAAVTRMVEKAESKGHQIGSQIAEINRNLIVAAKNAVSRFQEKGVGALQKAVAAMKIPDVLSRLREGMHQCVESMKTQAVKMEEVGREVHEVSTHRKNIGRLLVGKSQKEPEVKNPDKGILAKMQRGFLTAGRIFAGMEKGAAQLENRINAFQAKEAKKSSVKAELKTIKENHTGKMSRSTPVKEEQVR